MGEKSEFEPGDKAPNHGKYIETGENDFHMGIMDPRIVTLDSGDTFPETSNKNRKWKKKQ